ncbi:MAG: glycosyltransferase family 4 protein [Candidatus Omnitrophota bacterium]
MKKIAFVTPWPPQKSGISDYVYDLIKGLSKFDIQIEVYSNCQTPKKLDRVNVFNINETAINSRDDYDLIVYHIGNNIEYHGYIIDLLKKHGGVVHLHDMVLLHMMIAHKKSNLLELSSSVDKWYGKTISLLFQKLIKLDNTFLYEDIVTHIPMFEEVLQHADSCIVHSEYVKKRIRNVFPYIETHRIDHLFYNQNIIKTLHDNKKKTFRIGVFGGVEKNRHVDMIIMSCAQLLKEGFELELYIAGQVGCDCVDIYKLVNRLGISKKVYIFGRVDLEKFEELLAQSDVVVSLRNPTMGETSGVVMRAIQRAIPVIVSKTGWYSELPGFVDKVPLVNMKDELTKILKKYFIKEYYDKKKNAFIEYSEKHLNFTKAVATYHEILRAKKKDKDCLSKVLNRKLDSLEIKNNLLREIPFKKLTNNINNSHENQKENDLNSKSQWQLKASDLEKDINLKDQKIDLLTKELECVYHSESYRFFIRPIIWPFLSILKFIFKWRSK